MGIILALPSVLAARSPLVALCRRKTILQRVSLVLHILHQLLEAVFAAALNGPDCLVDLLVSGCADTLVVLVLFVHVEVDDFLGGKVASVPAKELSSCCCREI